LKNIKITEVVPAHTVMVPETTKETLYYECEKCGAKNVDAHTIDEHERHHPVSYDEMELAGYRFLRFHSELDKDNYIRTQDCEVQEGGKDSKHPDFNPNTWWFFQYETGHTSGGDYTDWYRMMNLQEVLMSRRSALKDAKAMIIVASKDIEELGKYLDSVGSKG
jgi:hypothetical protein